MIVAKALLFVPALLPAGIGLPTDWKRLCMLILKIFATTERARRASDNGSLVGRLAKISAAWALSPA